MFQQEHDDDFSEAVIFNRVQRFARTRQRERDILHVVDDDDDVDESGSVQVGTDVGRQRRDELNERKQSA